MKKIGIYVYAYVVYVYVHVHVYVYANNANDFADANAMLTMIKKREQNPPFETRG